jgi:hypothetical protein
MENDEMSRNKEELKLELVEKRKEEAELIQKLVDSPTAKEFKRRKFLERYAYVCSDKLRDFNINPSDLHENDAHFCSVDNNFPLWLSPALYRVPVKYLPFEVVPYSPINEIEHATNRYEKMIGCKIEDLYRLVENKKIILVSSPYDMYTDIIKAFCDEEKYELYNIFMEDSLRPIDQFSRVPSASLLPFEDINLILSSTNAIFDNYGGPRTAYFYCAANFSNCKEDEDLDEFASIISGNETPLEAILSLPEEVSRPEALSALYSSIVLHQINSFGQTPMSVCGSLLSKAIKLYKYTKSDGTRAFVSPELEYTFLGFPWDYVERMIREERIKRTLDVPSIDQIVQGRNILDNFDFRDNLIRILPRIRQEYVKILREYDHAVDDKVKSISDALDERIRELNQHLDNLIEGKTRMDSWVGFLGEKVLPKSIAAGAAFAATTVLFPALGDLQPSISASTLAAAAAVAGSNLGGIAQDEIEAAVSKGWRKFKSMTWHDVLSYELWDICRSREKK